MCIMHRPLLMTHLSLAKFYSKSVESMNNSRSRTHLVEKVYQSSPISHSIKAFNDFKAPCFFFFSRLKIPPTVQTSGNGRSLIHLELLLVNFIWPRDEYDSNLSFEKKLKTKLKELIFKV